MIVVLAFNELRRNQSVTQCLTPVGIYLLKVNNRNTRARWSIKIAGALVLNFLGATSFDILDGFKEKLEKRPGSLAI